MRQVFCILLGAIPLYGSQDPLITPTFEQAPASTYERLERALWEQSSFAMDDKHYSKAIQILLQLTHQFETSLMKSQYLYRLHQAYFHMSDFSHSLACLQSILGMPPESPYYKEALLEAAKIYVGMAKEQDAVAMYETYLVRFPKDQGRESVLLKTATLKASLGLYKASLDTLKHTAHTNNKIDWYERMWRSYKVLNQTKDLNTLSHKILDLEFTKQTAFMKVKAYQRLMVEAFHRSNLMHLNGYVTDLQNLSKIHTQDVPELLCQAHFLQGKLMAKKFVHTLKDTSPENQTLSFDALQMETLKDTYASIKKVFLSSCEILKTGYCVSSMGAILQLNHQMTDLGMSLGLSESESAKMVDFFKQDQLRLESDIEGLLVQGGGHPKRIEKLLWQLHQDMDMGDADELGYTQVYKPREAL